MHTVFELHFFSLYVSQCFLIILIINLIMLFLQFLIRIHSLEKNSIIIFVLANRFEFAHISVQLSSFHPSYPGMNIFIVYDHKRGNPRKKAEPLFFIWQFTNHNTCVYECMYVCMRGVLLFLKSECGQATANSCVSNPQLDRQRFGWP